MDKKSVYKYLSLLNVDVPRNAQGIHGWVMARCPLAPWTHGKGYDKLPSFGVSINDKGKSGYNCFGCKHKGTLAGLAFKMAHYTDDTDLKDVGRQIERTEIIGMPDLPEWDEDDDDTEENETRTRKAPKPKEGNAFREYPPFYYDNRAIQYLRDIRGLGFTDACKLGLRWDRRQHRVLFPVYDHWTGAFEGFTGRSIYNTSELEELSERRGRNIPKIRDYLGLNKRELLLGSRRGRALNGHDGCKHDGRLHTTETRFARGTIIVEGLFAFARVKSYIELHKRYAWADTSDAKSFPIEVRALLGSELTEEKANILDRIDAPIYWMTDDDLAGETCLQGVWNKDLDQFDGGGALDKFYGVLPQFRLQYPKGIDDPDDLSFRQYSKMLRKAKLHT